jgi:hypothetical protein
MGRRVDEEALDILFREARTYSAGLTRRSRTARSANSTRRSSGRRPARTPDAPELVEAAAKRNSSPQGAYLIVAGRRDGSGLRPVVRLRQREGGRREASRARAAIRSSSPRATSSRTSCATRAMAIPRGCTRDIPASASRRRARSCDGPPENTDPHGLAVCLSCVLLCVSVCVCVLPWPMPGECSRRAVPSDPRPVRT